MTLNRRLGLRAEHGEALAPGDVDVDAAQGEQTTEGDDDVTQLHEGRDALRLYHARHHRHACSCRCGGFRSHGLAAGGGAATGRGALRLGHAVDDRDRIARPRQVACLAPGESRDGRGVSALNVPPKVWSTCGMRATVFWTTSSSPSRTSCAT